MTFSSTTKSWTVCGKDQRREMIALAVFTKLRGLDGKAKAYVNSARLRLLSKIRILKDLECKTLNPDEKALLVMEEAVKVLGEDVGVFEGIFARVEKFLAVSGIEPLGVEMTRSLIKNKQLSKTISAIDKFNWTGGATKPPLGKTEEIIGIPDSLLESLMEITHADGLLTSWLVAGDATWKKYVDGMIEERKNEIRRLRQKSSTERDIVRLEGEIKKLEKDWKL